MEDPPDDPSPAQPAQVVDARGHRCPVPTLRLRRALERAGSGDRVLLLADDPMARIDVPYFLSEAGHVLVNSGGQDGALSFLVEKQ
ncbi:MAG: SirA family protein [Caulobacterales bacterium 32-69-10]|nr:MAG: SirA family protein [Caulobacterales bacterium 32-69-10]